MIYCEHVYYIVYNVAGLTVLYRAHLITETDLSISPHMRVLECLNEFLVRAGLQLKYDLLGDGRLKQTDKVLHNSPEQLNTCI